MPAGTPPDKVLAATRDFAREHFALKYRYAMALHTDEPHPHVHMVVKAVSEQGVRLNIRKATLREWRRDFARHLRARVDAVAADIVSGRRSLEPGKTTLVKTRKEVLRGWLAVSDMLDRQGQPELAASARRFVDSMRMPRTDREQMTADLIQHIQETRHRRMDREVLSR